MLKHTIWGKVNSRIPYIVSIDGDLICLSYVDTADRKRKQKNIKFIIDNKGYVIPTIKHGNIPSSKMHRLQMLTFYSDNINENVNHLNGIKDDNRIENLEWCTVLENIDHAIANNLRHPCLVAGHNVFNEAMKMKIKNIGSDVSLSNREIGRILGIDKTTVRKYR